MENLNRPINKEIESVIKKFPTKKGAGLEGFPGEFYQSFIKYLPLIHMGVRGIDPPPHGVKIQHMTCFEIFKI